MWPIRQWLSGRPDFLRLLQRTPRVGAIWHSYEKAGLQVSDEPIPWNAETAIVEALIEWSGKPVDPRSDFELHIAGETPIGPAALEPCDHALYRIVFRLAPFQRSRMAVLHWRAKPIGFVELPHVSRETFLQVLQIESPTLFARLRGECLACRCLVEGQACDLLACGLLKSSISLLPLLDAGLAIEVGSYTGGRSVAIPFRLSAEQLIGHQTALAVPIPQLSGVGYQSASWIVCGRTIARRDLRVIGRDCFLDSLYVPAGWNGPSADSGRIPASNPSGVQKKHWPELYLRVASREPGVTALCHVEMRLRYGSCVRKTLPQEILITDVPWPCISLQDLTADLRDLEAIEVFVDGRFLGRVASQAVPAAAFTAEGGFVACPNRPWTPFDELELEERLEHLLVAEARAPASSAGSN